MNIGFTLCFIQYNENILMLYRNKPPNQFRWNGVGGKIESDEAPKDSCLREIEEETGLKIKTLDFRGIVTWNDAGGMYVYVAQSASGQVVSSDEGRLGWQSVHWVMTHSEVVSNIPIFLPHMLQQDKPLVEHAFRYNEQEEVIGYQQRALEQRIIAYASTSKSFTDTLKQKVNTND